MMTYDVSPTDIGDIALEGRNLRFGYGSRTIFKDVSLHVRKREIVCLLGGSGCGKSTLLRVLAGLAEQQQGEVSFLGKPLDAPHPRAALVFQQASLLPWLDVTGNAGFGLDFARQPVIDKQTRQARIAEALEAVGLRGHERAFPAQLSGGMAQRVALARALAREPELLFADEPFSALDAITRAGMQTLLVELVHRWHTAVLLVTHDIDEAILVADRILLMGKDEGPDAPGRIVQEWTLDIPRPREAHTNEVTELRMQILSALRQLQITA
ncbi:ABC transporter ATP-binding protein [Oxalicibacterium faecigallinarum]|uniref:ABC transporter ATP-binding protein n=1 Tax=Oxalicibacterium faecigallinarum TaxID=573741 RepID=A0A8J3AXA9_9BURK|nr:ABC transporter ATP-binding protein [Oxalicibacterium faecigallinarum]